jgi:glutamate synthase domain-containing protein 2
VGIATQDPNLRARLPVDEAADRLARFLSASVDLMKVMARACGHERLDQFSPTDLTTFDRDLHHLANVPYGGLGAG